MTTIILFYWNQCHYCEEFKPVWNEIKEWCAKNNVKQMEYEDAEVQQMKMDLGRNNSGIPLDGIEGYPSIFIKKEGEIIQVKDRRKDSILRLLGKDTDKNSKSQKIVQTGGGVNIGGTCSKEQHKHYGGTCKGTGCPINVQTDGTNYKEKYLKYKAKYVNLKHRL